MKRTLTYRGSLEQSEKRKIPLETKTGSLGYAITKFEIIPRNFGGSSSELESTVKIYANDPGSIDAVVNFDDMDLLGVAVLGMDSDPSTYPMNMISTFEALVFNQNIFITHYNNHGDAAAINYYIELEQFTISKLDSATLTLKNMRNRVV